MEKGSKRLMTVEVHLMTLVMSGLQEFIAKMRSSCSLGPVRTELAVRTLHSAVACEKKVHQHEIKYMYKLFISALEERKVIIDDLMYGKDDGC